MAANVRCAGSPGQGHDSSGATVDFEIPSEIQSTLDALDAFIEREIRPLEEADDNVRFFDHRREYARTDFEHGGVPRQDWEDLLAEMRRRADAAGWLASRAARGVRRSRRDEPRDGDHPGAPGDEGPRAAQRPAERELDRRQLPDGADDARLRDRRAAGRVDARLPRRHPPARVRAHRAEPRLRRDLPRDHGSSRRRRVGHQRHEAVQLRAAPRDARHRVRAHVGRTGLAGRHHRVPRAHRCRRVQRRLLLVDVQHADRPRGGDAARRARRCRCGVRRGRSRARARAALRAREPDPPGRVVARCRAVLHQRGGGLRDRVGRPGGSRWRATRRSSSRSSSCTPRPRCCGS